MIHLCAGASYDADYADEKRHQDLLRGHNFMATTVHHSDEDILIHIWVDLTWETKGELNTCVVTHL